MPGLECFRCISNKILEVIRIFFCHLLIFLFNREVNSYKSINFHIDKLLIDLRQLHFVSIGELSEYDPEAFCKAQYTQMNLQVILKPILITVTILITDMFVIQTVDHNTDFEMFGLFCLHFYLLPTLAE